MPYEYLPDIAIADVAFRAWAGTLEGMFAAAADAVMNVMVEDLETIGNRVAKPIRGRNADIDMLLFQMLEEMIFLKDAEKLLLRIHRVAIGREGADYLLDAEAWGEVLDPGRHDLGVDVKAVTLHRFRVEQVPDGWETEVVVDV
jgi:SHS2 domain-containing protein